MVCRVTWSKSDNKAAARRLEAGVSINPKQMSPDSQKISCSAVPSSGTSQYNKSCILVELNRPLLSADSSAMISPVALSLSSSFFGGGNGLDQ